MDIANVCVRPSASRDISRWEFFLHNSSQNTCRERVKFVASCRTYAFLEEAFEQEGDSVSKNMLPEILDSKMVLGLLEMSRLHPQNRYKNELFGVCLKRKLRLNLWHEPGRHKCPICGKEVDKKGDHYYRCNRVSKTPMHDKWRDGIKKILEDILPLVKLIRFSTTVRDE